jgi:hypothetical protein
LFVLNKKTGLKWDVDGELLERLKKNPDYEVIEKPKQETKKDDSKKKSAAKK